MKKFNNYMKIVFPIFILLLVFLQGKPVNAQGFSQETQERLQQVLVNIQDNPTHSFVGGISASVKVDGLASWQGATGFAARNVDGQNNLLPGGQTFAPSTLSRTYSITKTLTAALVLELAKEGVLNLDQTIGSYLPLINAYNPRLNNSVTVRQLLNHRSGYSDWEEEFQLQVAIAYDPTHVWTPYELMVFTRQLSTPGTLQRYSHNNFVFLGAIIEAATGRPIQELFRERFIEPLGLTSMYLEGREPHGGRALLASPHDNISPFNPIFQFTGQPTFPNSYTNISRFPFTAITSLGFTGGSIVANAADIADWSNALFGGRITSPGVLDTLLQSISPVPDPFGNLLGYGIKNTANISGAYDFIGHNGSAPGYRSAMFYNAERKMTIVVLTNYAGANAYTISKKLFEALPDFVCGNDKNSKIIVCSNNNALCVARPAAEVLIQKGAYLGACDANRSNLSGLSEIGTRILPENYVKVSPNPAQSGILRAAFRTSVPGKVSLTLFDMNGKVVSKVYNFEVAKSTEHKAHIETTGLAEGTYILVMKSSTGMTKEKIVISR